MPTLNWGRMVALFLCVLFARNVSFAQDDQWETVVVYMVDPVVKESLAREVEDYIDKWKDPLTWETFERDFTPARNAQMAQVARDNDFRKREAEALLREDLRDRGDGTSSWYPSWIPLALAETTEDSLFKNILNIEGAPYFDRPGLQTLREFFEQDGAEPDRAAEAFRFCDDDRPRCRKEFYAHFRDLVDIHDASLVAPSEPGEDHHHPETSLRSPIISFTIQAKASEDSGVPTTPSRTPFVDELNEGFRQAQPGESREFVDFRWESIQLLQPAAMDPDEYVIDVSPYWQPAAKSVASTETSSWGRIKATFAD